MAGDGWGGAGGSAEGEGVGCGLSDVSVLLRWRYQKSSVGYRRGRRARSESALNGALVPADVLEP